MMLGGTLETPNQTVLNLVDSLRMERVALKKLDCCSFQFEDRPAMCETDDYHCNLSSRFDSTFEEKVATEAIHSIDR